MKKPLAQAGFALQRAGYLLTCLAAASMSLREFRDEVAQSFADFMATDAEILAGLMPWEARMYARLKPPGRLLLVGCGTGRDLLPLLAMGWEVTGVEPLGTALHHLRDILAARRLHARLIEGYVEDLALDGSFDAISFSYFCYSYIPLRSRRIDVLRKARAALSSGGHILISHNTEPHRGRGLVVRVARLWGGLLGRDWRLEPGDRLWPGVDTSRIIRYEHVFVPGELAEEAREAGLRVLYPGDPAEDPFTILAVA